MMDLRNAGVEWDSMKSVVARFCAFLCILLWITGCVSTEPVKDSAEEVPLETRQHLASYNYNLAQKFWERDRADLTMRYLKMAVRQRQTARSTKY